MNWEDLEAKQKRSIVEAATRRDKARAEVLAAANEMADIPPTISDNGRTYCVVCGALMPEIHTTDCVWARLDRAVRSLRALDAPNTEIKP